MAKSSVIQRQAIVTGLHNMLALGDGTATQVRVEKY